MFLYCSHSKHSLMSHCSVCNFTSETFYCKQTEDGSVPDTVTGYQRSQSILLQLYMYKYGLWL